MVNYKIIFPDENKVKKDLEEDKKRINFMLKKINQGILSRILVFLYHYEVCSTTELTGLLTSFYIIVYDRANITKYLQTLINLNLIAKNEAYYAMAHNSNEILKMIKSKHEELLKSIPPQFHKQFNNVNYYYVTDYGKQFVPWACEVIGFNCEEKK